MKNSLTAGLCRCLVWQVLSMLVFLGPKTYGQMINASNYPVTTYTNVPLENMSGATTIFSSGVANATSGLIKMGPNFTFCLAGVCYDSLAINSQGKVRLGPGFPFLTPFFGYGSPEISPLSNLMSTGNNGFVSYKLIGTAPHRKFVIHWKVKLTSNVTTLTAADEFQLALYESGRIDFNYGNTPASWAGTNTSNERSYQCGFSYKLQAGQAQEHVLVDVLDPGFSASNAVYGMNTFYNREPIPLQSRISFIPDSSRVNPPYCVFGNMGTACVQILITDTTHNETFYDVYRSTNGINYNTFVKRVYTNTPGTGQVHFVKDSALASVSNYSYAVIAGNYSMPPAKVIIDTTTTLPQLSGVRTIPGHYASISEALMDIRCRQIAADLVLELGSGYSSAGESFPLVIDNTLWTGPAKKLTIRPAAGVSALSINNPGPGVLLQLKNAKYFTLDGRPGGTGTVSAIMLKNDTSASNVILMSAGSQYNAVKNCFIRGKGRYDLLQQALVWIDSISNSYNQFIGCEFSPSAPGNWVESAIVSNGSDIFPNLSNEIIACNFTNWGSKAQKTWFGMNPIKVVELRKGNSVWKITGNSFYLTDTMKAISNVYCLCVSSPRGNDFLISGNYFGGRGPKCSGGKMPVDVNGSGLKFISLTAGQAAYSVIRRNRIANIELNGTGINGNCCYNFDFIESNCTRVMIDSNMVGDTLARASIVYSFPQNNFYPVDLNFIHAKPSNNPDGSVTPTYYIHRNAAGGLKFNGKFSFVGINVESYNLREEVYITNNSIGGTADSSIYCQADIVGIKGASGGEDSLLVLNNVIRNLSAGYAPYASSGVGKVAGIFFSQGWTNIVSPDHLVLTISGNKIFNIRDNNDGQSNNTGISSAFGGIVGICAATSAGTVLIEGNEIHSFHNVRRGSVRGISVGQYQSACYTRVTRNFIHNMYLDEAPGQVDGIFTYMKVKLDNNMIALGRDENGGPIFNGAQLNGIKVYHTGGDTLEIDHNSIYIGGGPQNTQNGMGACVDIGQNTQGNYYNVKMRNNILYNDRFGLNHNFIVNLPQGWPVYTLFQCDYNQYYAGGFSYFMDWNYSFPAWQAGTGLDRHSYFATPRFINPTGSAQTCDLHLQFANNSEGRGLNIGMDYDFDKDNRLLLSPVDIGADAGNFHAIPMITLGPDTSLCVNDSITAPGSYSLYAWSNGATTKYLTISTPGIYKLTITDSLGYTSSDSITVTSIRQRPLVSAGADAAVCAGSPVMLNATGTATFYTWNNSISNGVAFTPTATLDYIVVGQATNNCTSSDTVKVTVNLLPAVNAGSDQKVCAGGSLTLTATGAASFAWNNNVLNGIGFVPTYSGNYLVTGTDQNGCSAKDTVKVTVDPLPVIYAGSDKTVCAGSSLVLLATGAPILSWNNGVINGIGFIPAASSQYIVTGTDQNSCSSSDTLFVSVNPLPVISLSLPVTVVCVNDASIALSGATPAGGAWSGTGVHARYFDPFQAGTGTHQVIYTYKDANACTAQASATIAVDACSGIRSLAPRASLQLYPNPAATFIYLVSGSEITRIIISDETGRRVLVTEPGGRETCINIAQLAKGLYFVEVWTGDKVKYAKFSKQ